MHMPSDKEKVHIHVKPDMAKEVEYTDRATGERKSFNVMTLPDGCRLGGQDVSGWEFSPLFVNESSMFEGWKHIPLLADRTVRLSHSTVDGDGRLVLDGNGKRVKEFMEADPIDLADAIAEALGLS